MILVHNEINPGEYFYKLTDAAAAAAMESLSETGLRGWLKCLAGHIDGFAWKYPDLTREEERELEEKGFLAPMGHGTGDWEFDAMGGYGTPPQSQSPVYGQTIRTREPEQRRSREITPQTARSYTMASKPHRAEIRFKIEDGPGLMGEYNDEWLQADNRNGEAQLFHWKTCRYIPTGYTWEEANALAEDDDELPDYVERHAEDDELPF